MGQTISDFINAMMPLIDCFYAFILGIGQIGPIKSDPNKQLIPLTVIPLCGAHCITIINYECRNFTGYVPDVEGRVEGQIFVGGYVP